LATVDGKAEYVTIEIAYNFSTFFGDFLSSFAGGRWDLRFPLQTSITVRALG